MSEHQYSREILELVIVNEASTLLKEHILGLVRAGFFDEERVIGQAKTRVRRLIDEILNNDYSDLKNITDRDNLDKLRNLDFLSMAPRKKIYMLKEIKNATGWGLKESKEFTDIFQPKLEKIIT